MTEIGSTRRIRDSVGPGLASIYGMGGTIEYLLNHKIDVARVEVLRARNLSNGERVSAWEFSHYSHPKLIECLRWWLADRRQAKQARKSLPRATVIKDSK